MQANPPLLSSTPDQIPDAPVAFLLPLTLFWNAVVALACILVSIQIFGVEDFGGLGRPVQYFAGAVVLLPVAALAWLSYALLMGEKPDYQRFLTGKKSDKTTTFSQRNARYGLMFFYFVGAVLTGVYLIWQAGTFDGLEHLVDGFMLAPWLTYVFIAAYAISWIGGRAHSLILQRLSLVIGAVALVILLFNADIINGIIGAEGLLAAYKNLNIIMATLALIIFSVLAFSYLHAGRYFGETPEQRQAWQGWLMLSPNILGFMIFFAGPLLLSFYLSFTDDTVGQAPNVIWLQNYAEIMSFEFKNQPVADASQKSLSFGYTVLTTFEMGDNRLVVGAKDASFWISLRNTIVFCLLLLPLSIIPAIALSLVLNSALPGMKFYRAVFFLPSVAAVVGTAIIWRWLYSPDIGYYNYFITSILTWFNQTFGTSINDPKIAWLTDPNVVLISMVILSAWQIVGTNTVLFLAGLQGISRELYEAAMIDGASNWRSFWSITLPMLRPTTFFVVITVMVAGLQVFNEPYALFPSRPIPVQAQTSVFYLYQQGFFNFQFGYASAIAWFLFIIIFSLTFIQFRLQREDN